MALDLVESGNDDADSHGKQERVSKYLPSEVDSKMLYKDVVQIAWPSLVEMTLTQLASMVDDDGGSVGTMGYFCCGIVNAT